MKAYNTITLIGLAAEMALVPAGQGGRIFIATDTRRWYLDNGREWMPHALGAAVAAVVNAPLSIVNMHGASANQWVNVYPDAPAESVDAAGRTEFRVTATWSPRSATGVQSLRWMWGEFPLWDRANITGGIPPVLLDSGWLPLPEWAQTSIDLVWQCASTNANDDPYAHGWKLTVR